MSVLSKKVCLLGEFAVGKTSLVRRFIYDRFDDRYVSTIGVRVSRKTVAIPTNGDIIDLSMMLWDLGGSEAFDSVRASYLRGASGAVLVCDLTRSASLTALHHYIDDLHAIVPHTHLILAANKCDLVDQIQIDLPDLQTVAAQYNAPVYLTSAKQGDEVDALFRHLGRLMVA